MNTAAVDPKVEEAARKSVSAIFAGLSRVGQVQVALALGVAESTISKAKSDEIPTVARILAAAELKVVPAHYRCVEPRKMEALVMLAGQELDRLRARPELVWEDEA
jgi:hypothetical protein